MVDGDPGRLLAALEMPIRRALEPLRGDRQLPAHRIHGDLHAGQFLRAGDRLLLNDFDGNPLSDAAERRLPQTPMRDLAGLLQSIDHVGRIAVKRRHPDREADVQRFIAAGVDAALDRVRGAPCGRPPRPAGIARCPGTARVPLRRCAPAALDVRARCRHAGTVGHALMDADQFLRDLEAKPMWLRGTCRSPRHGGVAHRPRSAGAAHRHGLVVVRGRHDGASAASGGRIARWPTSPRWRGRGRLHPTLRWSASRRPAAAARRSTCCVCTTARAPRSRSRTRRTSICPLTTRCSCTPGPEASGVACRSYLHTLVMLLQLEQQIAGTVHDLAGRRCWPLPMPSTIC